MVVKFLTLVVFAAFVTQGLCVTEISLPDETTTFITNDLIGKSIGIAKSFLDKLESCHVIMPNGVLYEAYPNNNIEEGPIYVLKAVEPFNSCAIGFIGAPISFSGTYELLSLVRHSADNSQSLTRKKFHITFVESQMTK